MAFDPEVEARDAYRPIRIRSEAEVRADAERVKRERRDDALAGVFVVLAAVLVVAFVVVVRSVTGGGQ